MNINGNNFDTASIPSIQIPVSGINAIPSQSISSIATPPKTPVPNTEMGSTIDVIKEELEKLDEELHNGN